MGRAFSVALLALAAAAGAAGDLAAVVPEDALFYAEVNDPKGIWADFEQSGLRDIVRASAQAEMQLGVASAVVRGVAQERLGIPWDDFWTKFASRIAIVVAEGGGAGRLPVFLLDASENKAELAKLLAGSVEPALAKVRPNEPPAVLADDEHEGVALRLVKGPQGALAFAFVGHTLAVGEPPAIKRLIDARARRPLSANATFAEVRKTLSPPKGIVAYLNFAQLLADHRPVVEGNPEARAILDNLGLTTVQWITFASAFEGRGVRDKLHIHCGEKKIGLVRLLAALSPGTSAAATVLPKDCPLLLSLNFQDGPQLWQAILKFLQEGGHAEGLVKIDEGKQQVLAKFGINFDEDLVGALAGEAFLAANPDFTAEFAAKRRAPNNADFAFILAARVAKPEALKTAIHRLLAGQPGIAPAVERKTETYHDVEINTLVTPDKPHQPAYAFVGDFLIVARNAAIIRQCIAARATPAESLGASPRFRNVADAMPLKHHAIAYADLEGLLTALILGGAEPNPGQPIAPLRETLATLAGQLRGACATLAASERGITVEAYTRSGLIPLLGVVLNVAERQAAAARPPEPKAPKATDF